MVPSALEAGEAKLVASPKQARRYRLEDPLEGGREQDAGEGLGGREGTSREKREDENEKRKAFNIKGSPSFSPFSFGLKVLRG
jgi:hypothetical protein